MSFGINRIDSKDYIEGGKSVKSAVGNNNFEMISDFNSDGKENFDSESVNDDMSDKYNNDTLSKHLYYDMVSNRAFEASKNKLANGYRYLASPLSHDNSR